MSGKIKLLKALKSFKYEGVTDASASGISDE